MLEVTLRINAPGGSRQVPLAGESLTFGRTDASQVVIAEDKGLSRRHATLRRSGESVLLFDEGSTNGTTVNGRRVSAEGQTLSDGDEIRIGNETAITVSIKRAQAAAASTSPSDPARPAAAPGPASTPPAVLVSAVAVAVLVLGAIGFTLYKVTRPEQPPATDAAAAVEPSTTEVADLKSNLVTAPVEEAPTPQPSRAPLVKATENVSILSSDLSQPVPDAGEPAPGQRKLYKEMAEDEKNEFIKRRAQHVAMMMGRRPYAFTPDALKSIRFWLDAFSRRAGNGRTGLWGGDTTSILERGKVQAPTIVRAFRQNNVPVVVGLYIPFIETEYNNISTNNAAGAAGLFQFLGPTAEGYGVPASERTNIAKMAPAAARYFRDNIVSFGDDPMSVALSIAGYNRAPESVKRDLRNVLNAPNNEDKERSFWTLIANQAKLDEYFQRENVNYVPRFFAAAIFGETPWAFGINLRPLSTYTEGTDEAAAQAQTPQTPTSH